MARIFGAVARYLLTLTRLQRRFLLAISDLAILSFALWLAMSTRWGYLYVAPSWTTFGLLAAVPLVAIAAFSYLGLYSHVTRHFDALGDKLIFLGVSFSSLALGLGAFLLFAEGIPRSVLFVYPLFGTVMVSGSRRVVKHSIVQAGVTLPPPAAPGAIENVVIYGAGQSAQALFGAVRRTRNLEVVGLVDPDPDFWHQYIGGIRIYPPEQLAWLVGAYNIKQVLLATERSRKERLAVLAMTESLPVQLRVLPSLEDLALGRVTVSDLRPIEAHDLLGRAPIPPDHHLMARSIDGRCVMVTGAGGSIGSELVRQILKHDAKRIVLLSASETSLYNIEAEVQGILRRRAGADHPDIVGILGSVTNELLVEKTLRSYTVDIVYHAAAYKHVPILESNVVVGVRNNTIGTQTLANAAMRCGVETFVFVSTDKAVRPANVMGASKRAAEMLIQTCAANKATTKFSIVRFGNVLDSSGSVVRLFREQIAAGGPITVSHPEVTRYFISIPEAGALVLQAGSMAQGGEVFALDMGAPVRIDDLAKIMVRLSGLQVRDSDNPDGDIEIVFTGLRPGDKLLEEVNLSEQANPTEHPRILRVDEPFPTPERLQLAMHDLKAAIALDDPLAVKKVLYELVE